MLAILQRMFDTVDPRYSTRNGKKQLHKLDANDTLQSTGGLGRKTASVRGTKGRNRHVLRGQKGGLRVILVPTRWQNSWDGLRMDPQMGGFLLISCRYSQKTTHPQCPDVPKGPSREARATFSCWRPFGYGGGRYNRE